MNLPIVCLERIRATIVEIPDPSRTVPTWKPHKAATRTVAGNIVSTCWNPSRISRPQPGRSFGRYPLMDFAGADVAILRDPPLVGRARMPGSAVMEQELDFEGPRGGSPPPQPGFDAGGQGARRGPGPPSKGCP